MNATGSPAVPGPKCCNSHPLRLHRALAEIISARRSGTRSTRRNRHAGRLLPSCASRPMRSDRRVESFGKANDVSRNSDARPQT